MFKELVKLSVSGSAVSGVILIDLQHKSVATNGEKTLSENIKSNMTGIKSIADIALYEKAKGCTFVFSNSEGLENLYTGEGFLEELENLKKEHKNLTLSARSIFEWANGGIKECGNKVVTIFREGDKLRLGEPKGGWGT